MITNQLLAELIQSKLNGPFNPETGEYTNISKYNLNKVKPNLRYEFKIFANDGEYTKAENRGAQESGAVTNTVTQYINGVLKTPGGSSVEGMSAETLNAAVEAQIELLIPDCDEPCTLTVDGVTYTIRLQDMVYMLVNDALSLPSSNTVERDNISYSIGARYSHAAVGEKRHRTQSGLSVILTLFIAFAIVAEGVSSREITLEIDGETVYYNKISISRVSTQENNVEASPNDDEETVYGVARSRTTSTQLIIGFSAPVRPTALNKALSRYLVLGEVVKMSVTLSLPTDTVDGELQRETQTFTMVFGEGGVAGEENLNAAFDIRLSEEMEVANG